MKNHYWKISIIIPFFDEKETLSILIKDLIGIINLFSKDSEIIFVDDGSTDGGSEIVRKFADEESRVKLVVFKRHYGQTAAWAAGIDNAKGDLIAFLDADLQNDPCDIPLLVDQIEKGYDVASGWRRDRKDNLLLRVIPSRVANRLISCVTNIRLHDYGCSLKIYRKEFIKDIKLYGEMHRFLPALAAWEGAKIIEVPVNHRPRCHGASKYGPIRIFKVLLDLVTVTFLEGFVTKPIYFFGLLGLVSFFLGLGSLGVVSYRVLILNHKEATPMVFMMVVFFIAFIQFTLMGLLAELVTRTYYEAQSKKVYKIQSLKNL